MFVSWAVMVSNSLCQEIRREFENQEGQKVQKDGGKENRWKGGKKKAENAREAKDSEEGEGNIIRISDKAFIHGEIYINSPPPHPRFSIPLAFFSGYHVSCANQ